MKAPRNEERRIYGEALVELDQVSDQKEDTEESSDSSSESSLEQIISTSAKNSNTKNEGGIFKRILVAAFYPKPRTEKEKWENVWDFRLTMIGYTVLFGNVSNFPFAVAKYGGGSFLLVYLLSFFFLSYPIFFLELFFGQFTGKKMLEIFNNIAPAMAGIGWTMIGGMIIFGVNNNVRVSWALFYMFSSFQSPLVWSHCDHSWNSKYCFSLESYKNCVGDQPEQRWFLKGKCYNNTSISDFFHDLDMCIETHKIKWECKVGLEFDFADGSEMKRKLGNGSYYQVFQNQKFPIGRAYDKCLNKFTFSPRCYVFDKKENFKLRIQLWSSTNELKSMNIRVTKLAEMYCETDKISIQCSRKIIRPVENHTSREHYHFLLHHPQADIHHLGGFHWPLPLVLMLAWLIVFLGLLGGFRSLGKFVHFTVTAPFVGAGVFVIYGIVLDGQNGFPGAFFYMKTELCALKDPNLWFEAVVLAYFCSGLGHGIITTLASFNHNNDVFTDSLIIVLPGLLFSVICGFGVFGFLGFLANKLDVEVSDLVPSPDDQEGPFFMVEALAAVPLSKLWSFLFNFFFSLLLINTELPVVCCFLMTLFGQIPVNRRRRRIIVTAVVCCSGFLLGLPFVTRYGLELSKTVCSGAAYLILFTSVGQLLAMTHVYGVRNVMKDISLMLPPETRTQMSPKRNKFQLGRWVWNTLPMKQYLWVCWRVVVPATVVAIAGVFLYSDMEKEKSDREATEDFMLWFLGFGVVILCVMGGLSVAIYRNIPLRKWCIPTDKWSPHDRYGMKAKQKSKDFSSRRKPDEQERIQERGKEKPSDADEIGSRYEGFGVRWWVYGMWIVKTKDEG